MAYVNVKDWTVDQVTDWLKGLDDGILQYTTSFLNNGVTGEQLLNLWLDDLDNLGVRILGHQELILEAVEHLRHFHFELDKENLQTLALKVCCASNSLYRELLSVDDDTKVMQNQTMSDVHNIITAIKSLVCWLDRAPFANDKDYIENKVQLLQLSFEMATCVHRDRFSEQPVVAARKICEKITKIASHIIQDLSDPLILQPASLDLATLKKKEEELGFFILPHNQAIHQIAEIKYGSPAHSSTKIEEGDEIVQVNYQTIVGWQRKNVMMLLQDSPPEIVLTLKKRPKHTTVYGQIYMQPYKLPSKRRDRYSRWNDSIPSPRLLPIHNLPPINLPKMQSANEVHDVEAELSSSEDSEPPDSPLDGTVRMYPIKPRPILQRRNTISGSTPTSKRPFPPVEQYWKMWKDQATSAHSSIYNINNTTNFDSEGTFLRDKSASCNLGIELSPRPTTVIGIAPNRQKTTSFNKVGKKRVNFQEKNKTLTPTNLDEEKSVSVNSLASLTNENIAFIDEGRELTDRTSMVTNSDENKENNQESEERVSVSVHDIIKKFDNEKTNECAVIVKPKIFPRSQVKKPPDVPQKPETKKPLVPPRSATTKLRGRLDKSHSTPAYDLTGSDESTSSEKLVNDESVTTTNSPKIIELEPFSETKYELGIPVISEAVNLPLLEEAPIINEITIDDLPPKPPPRTFGLVDINKPAYPSDSPKPVISIEKLTKNDALLSQQQQKQIFEFPVEALPTGKNKNFEPKLASTPKKTNDYGDYNNEVSTKVVPTFEVQKSMSDSKISPTNSIVRAMIYSNRHKAGKKKNSIVAKRRKVSVNDLSPPDIQGYLYQRLRSKYNQNVHWEKRWFVLLGSCLYGFKTKDDLRASCLIFLSGFTVAVASEVKSRSNAFKVYHTGTVFYFSADDPETLQSWIETITAATLNNNESLNKIADGTLYSETDESDGENNTNIKSKKTNDQIEKNHNNNNNESLRKFGSLKKFGSKKHDNTASGSTSLDRKWFFNKSSSHSKNSLPVPTAQFRSYRKIRSNNDESNNVGNNSVTTGNFTSHVAFFAPKLCVENNVSVPNLTVDQQQNNNNNDDDNNVQKLAKVQPLNYVHASNPSLLNIGDFNVVPTFTKSSKSSFVNNNESLAGFVTLEELMNRQSEERRSNPYNMAEEEVAINLNLIKPDVVYGEVPIRPKERIDVTALDSPSKPPEEESSSCFGKRLGSLKKSNNNTNFDNKTSTYPKLSRGFDQKFNRSLPRTHKLQDNSSNKYASDRNLAFKERSYEMIYCPEMQSDIQFAQNRNLDDRMVKSKGGKIKKQHSFNSSDKKGAQYSNKVGDSSSSSRVKLKSAMQYTPMALPLNQDAKSKPKLAFELNLDEKSAKSGKLKQIFGKPSDNKKEKTFLGSPKLHRAIFRKNSDNRNWPANSTQLLKSNMSQSVYSLEDSTQTLLTEPLSMNVSPHVDYPGLEYPPVFEPETYSLADPQSSLTLLRKQGKN